ncbi:3-dehydroquinate synthase [compost metagenome]
MEKFQLPVMIDAAYSTDDIMSAMQHDKKFRDGKMVYIVPTAIGKVRIDSSVSADMVRAVVDELKGGE